MTQTVSIWFVIAVALVAANLPFMSDRALAVLPLRGPKSLSMRLVELVVMYFATGLLGMLLERRLGQATSQAWEFYAVTGALFITFAFPGFVWRYLVKHRR